MRRVSTKEGREGVLLRKKEMEGVEYLQRTIANIRPHQLTSKCFFASTLPSDLTGSCTAEVDVSVDNMMSKVGIHGEQEKG